MTRFAILLASIALAAPAAAQASGADWPAAAKAYAENKASGTTPQTTGEYAMCAGWWSAWSKALAAKKLGAAELKQLPRELQAKAAKSAAKSWTGKAGKDSKADIAGIEAEAAGTIDSAIGGSAFDASTALQMLGLCYV